MSPDAREAHQRLSRHAAALAAVSASFAFKALSVADAYSLALASGRREDWASFVGAAAALTSHTASVAALLGLTAREREADEYFAQIVLENGDLLADGVSFAA